MGVVGIFKCQKVIKNKDSEVFSRFSLGPVGPVGQSVRMGIMVRGGHYGAGRFVSVVAGPRLVRSGWEHTGQTGIEVILSSCRGVEGWRERAVEL